MIIGLFAIAWLIAGWLSVMYMAWVSTHIEGTPLFIVVTIEDIIAIMWFMAVWPLTLIISSLVHIQRSKS